MSLQLPPGADPSDVPLSMPPPGVGPKFNNSPSLRPTELGLINTLIILDPRYNYLNITFITPTLGFLKLSVFLVYYHIFWPMRWLKIALYIGGLVTCIFHGILTIYHLVLSIPRHGIPWSQWLFSPEEAKTNNISLPTGIFGWIADVSLIVLPVPAVMKLQIPTKKEDWRALCFCNGYVFCESWHPPNTNEQLSESGNTNALTGHALLPALAYTTALRF